MRTSAALNAAICIPLLLALAWLPRDAPPDWPCNTPMPAGQFDEIADWRVGLAPAFVLAVALLAGLSARLSFDRRRALGVPSRPGAPTAVAAVLALVGAIRAAPGLDGFADLAIILVFASPLLLFALLASFAWIAWQPPGLKATAFAQIVVWISVLATVVVAGAISDVGREEWCLD